MTKKLSAYLGSFALLTLTALSAQARSISAFSGQAQQPDSYNCFGNSGGAVYNSCSTTRRHCTALVVDSSGGKTVTARVYAPSSSSTVSCFAAAVNQSGYQTSGSPAVGPTTFGTDVSLTLSGASTPSAGYLYACCDVNPGAWIKGFNW